MSIAAFDPLQILKTLDRHGVNFVVIGGIAGRLWGTTVTNDLDICYARDDDNREGLGAALAELKAKLRGRQTADRDRDHFTFSTTAGNLDILGTPAGSSGYNSLARTATRMDVGGVAVLVAAIEDLILMKRAVARPKDLVEVEILSAVREELEKM